jgi:hypothetical protein
MASPVNEPLLTCSSPSICRITSPPALSLTFARLPLPVLPRPLCLARLSEAATRVSEHQQFFDKAHYRILPVRRVIDDAFAGHL